MALVGKRLEGKVAIVTGSSSGIGQGIAIRFAREGAAGVTVNYLKNEEGARATADEVEKHGAKALIVKADVIDESQVETLVSQTVKTFDRLDILVNNVGWYFEAPFLQTTVEDFQKVMDLNVKSAYLCSRRALPEMIRSGRGRIINISSIDGLAAEPGCSLYCIAKSAIIGLNNALAYEFGPKKITVNTIAPSNIMTPPTVNWLKEHENEAVKATPAGRIGVPNDVATAALFLASDDADYINGVVVPVDGGQLVVSM